MKNSIENSIEKRLLSDENIYLAIYSLNSSGIDEYLLSSDDYIQYIKLKDKFNKPLISNQIEAVKKELERILYSNHYFDCKVFFNPKSKAETNNSNPILNYNYRPLHTSSLTNQIAMISMLNVLVYDIDKYNKISISELGKLLPDNFYGNRVAKEPEMLFKPWVKQYKKYCDNSNELVRKFKVTDEYKYEITFDLQNFFPSINPIYLYKYIIGLLPIYYDTEELKTLCKIVEKLIFVNVINLEEDKTQELYYGRKLESCSTFALGIAQGLPHTYFFANLFMIRVKDIYEKQFKESKMLFYVDDSVIYTDGKDSKGNLLIHEIFDPKNNELVKKINEDISSKISDLLDIKALEKFNITNSKIEEFVKENESLFKIELHKFSENENEEKKSQICKIKDVVDFGGFLARQASMISGSRNKLFDDDSNKILFEKTKILLSLVDEELKNQQKSKHDTEKKKKYIRYKKFLKNRAKFLSLTIDGNIDKVIDNINKKLEDLISKKDNVEDFSKSFFEEYADSTLIYDIQFVIQSNFKCKLELKKMYESFKSINKTLFAYNNIKSSYLYKLLEFIDNSKRINNEYNNTSKYKSLESIVSYRLGISYNKSKNTKNRILDNEIANFFAGFSNKDIIDEKDNYNKNIIGHSNYNKLIEKEKFECKKKFINGYVDSFFEETDKDFSEITSLVLENSEELYRMLFNSIVSYLSQITISDEFLINKRSNILIHYYELRLVLFLRNRNFKINELEAHYKECIKNEFNKEIDYSVLEVLTIFSKYVKNPHQIDTLILTHKYISDVWRNGSKQLYFYTLHNQDHAIALIKNSIKLTKSLDFLQIKPFDYYILFLSCYLHDISMVTIPNYDLLLEDNSETDLIYSNFISDISSMSHSVNPIKVKSTLKDYYLMIDNYFETLVRGSHGSDSSREILNRPTLSFLSDEIRDFISVISLAHTSSAKEIYGTTSIANSSIISIKFIKILLRLSDLLDMGNGRISDLLLNHNLENMNATTRFHWLSHSITEGYHIKNSYFIKERNKPDLFFHQNVVENITITIFVDLLQLTPMETSLNCKKMCYLTDPQKMTIREKEKENLNNEYDPEVDENEYNFEDDLFNKDLLIKINNNDNCKKCNSCNFLCKWIVIKNKYLFDELYALQSYLQSIPNNLFLTKFYVEVKLINKEILKNKEFNYLKNYIDNKDNK